MRRFLLLCSKAVFLRILSYILHQTNDVWEDYNGTFKIDPNNRYVVYTKVTDNAGNTLYINSDGIVLDNIAPTLEGIEDGKTYYGDLTVIKSDEQFYDIKTVKDK